VRSARVVYANFGPTEDQIAYQLMLRTLAFTHRLPHILYHNQQAILRSPKLATIEDELDA
jgi:hypothetical protein